jgi:hypothetical protein
MPPPGTQQPFAECRYRPFACSRSPIAGVHGLNGMHFDLLAILELIRDAFSCAFPRFGHLVCIHLLRNESLDRS